MDIKHLQAMATCLDICRNTPWLERIARDVRQVIEEKKQMAKELRKLEELWQYTGEPTPEEIAKREPYYQHDHLAIRHQCPNCGGRNTTWIRQEWNVCFTCCIAFTLEDVIGCYDTQAYEKDVRPPAEVLDNY